MKVTALNINNVKNFEAECNNVTVFSYGSMACDGVYHFSDERIKQDINDINDNEALEKIRLLKPKTYRYKNELEKGDDVVIGFISQEVKEVIPEAVCVESYIIPNIYTNAVMNVTQKTDILKLSPEEYNAIPHPDLRASYTFDVSLNMYTKTISYPYSNVITFDTSKLLDNNLKIVIKNHNTDRGLVYEIQNINGNTIELDKDVFKMSQDRSNVFIYGQPVDDFHILKKDYLWGMSMAALQEIDRQQQVDKAKFLTLETQLTDLLARVQSLESN